MIYLWILLRMRNVSDKKLTKAKHVCSIIFPQKSCRLWDSVEQYGRAGQTKATDTHSRVCNTCCFSTATVVTRTRLIRTSILHCLVSNMACLVSNMAWACTALVPHLQLWYLRWLGSVISENELQAEVPYVLHGLFTERLLQSSEHISVPMTSIRMT
jgi:hypothetical protein